MKKSPDKQSALDSTYWLDHHGDDLYGYAFTRVRDVAVAEDLLQETLTAAMGGYQEHGGRSSERTWLVGILRHKIVDHFRRLARTPEFQVETAEAGADVDVFEREGPWRGHWREAQAPVNWPLDVTLLESKEFWETLERCLARLSPQMAAAFTLREIEGLSSEEICEILGISPNNLWVLLHRGRVKLRHFLEAEWFRGNRRATPATDNVKLQIRVGEFPPEFTMRAVPA
jgi:RNA polymerase sigma-70 factor (ECF subfamily)